MRTTAPTDPANSDTKEVSAHNHRNPGNSDANEETPAATTFIQRNLSFEEKFDIEHVPVHDDPRKWSSLRTWFFS